MKALLIVGTDTEVGKTVLTTGLVAYWQTYCSERPLGLMKLIQAGMGDREHYQQLFGEASFLRQCTPLCFSTPVAPPIAAEREGTKVDLATVWQAFSDLVQERFVLVEALGGLGSPVTAELTVADLARDWQLSTLLVVPVKLGAIAQTVANVALARMMKVRLRGIVLNCVEPVSDQQLADWTPIALIESLTQVPVLGVVPYLDNCQDLDKLAHVVSQLDLESLDVFRQI